MRRYLSAVLITTLLPLTAQAQTLREQTRTLAVDTISGPSRILSINPFILLFGYFAGEYEQRVSSVLSVALAGSYTNFDEKKYTNLDVKARLYPNELALRGFGIGASFGGSSITTRNADCVALDPNTPEDLTCNRRGRTFNVPSVALEMQYQWMLGSRKRTAITLGGGLKRFLGSEETLKTSGASRFLPTARATIGYAF